MIVSPTVKIISTYFDCWAEPVGAIGWTDDLQCVDSLLYIPGRDDV
jgi:hypothetical protein